MNTPSPFQKKTLWLSITGLSIFATAAIIVVSVAILGRTLSFLSPVLFLVAVAAIAAFLLYPVVRWFQTRKLSRTKATVVVLSLFALVLSLIGILVIPAAVNDIGRITDRESRNEVLHKISEGLEKLRQNSLFAPAVKWLAEDSTEADSIEPIPAEPIDQTEEADISTPPPPEQTLEEITPLPTELVDPENEKIDWKNSRLLSLIKDNADYLSKKGIEALRAGSSTLLGMIGTIIGLVMTPIFIFYFLKDSESIKEHWHEYLPLKASQFKTEIVETLKEINSYLVAFFRGQVLVSIIDGVLTGIALKMLGLPYAITIGVVLAVVGIMPFIGIIITFIPAVLIAFGHFGDWQHVLYVTLIFFAVQQIDGLLIQPKIVGDSVGLHPLTVIFSVLLWSLLLGGFIGALLAVPLTAAVKVLFRRYIWDRKLKPSPELFDSGDRALAEELS